MTTAISTINLDVIAEGKELSNLWLKMQKAERTKFSKSVNDGGFDLRLGKLLQQLKAQTANGRISSASLRTASVDKIDKRRRAEALWFAENEEECKAFIKASKKGFTSLTALQAAMRKANAQPKADKSNVGPKTESQPAEAQPEAATPTQPMTAGDIALQAMIQAEESGVSFADVARAIADLMVAEKKKAA